MRKINRVDPLKFVNMTAKFDLRNVLYPPPSFEAVYCFIDTRDRKVAVTQHCSAVEILQSFVRHRSDRILDFAGPNKTLSDQTFHKAYF